MIRNIIMRFIVETTYQGVYRYLTDINNDIGIVLRRAISASLH